MCSFDDTSITCSSNNQFVRGYASGTNVCLSERTANSLVKSSISLDPTGWNLPDQGAHLTHFKHHRLCQKIQVKTSSSKKITRCRLNDFPLIPGPSVLKVSIWARARLRVIAVLPAISCIICRPRVVTDNEIEFICLWALICCAHQAPDKLVGVNITVAIFIELRKDASQ